MVELPLIEEKVFSQFYCSRHDWQGGNTTPCVYCKNDERRAELAKHTPKKNFIYCQHCHSGAERYWTKGDPYTCNNCLPTERHLANIELFNRLLDGDD